MHASIVVVGGGLAGLELARELLRRGHRDVLVLEAGPADGNTHLHATHDPDEATEICFVPERDKYFHRSWSSDSPPHYTENSGLRRRLGGRSLYWHGVVLPIEPWALAEPWWPAEVVADLTGRWRRGASLYQRVESDLWRWRGRAADPGAITLGDLRFRPTPMARRASREPGRWSAYTPLEFLPPGDESGGLRFRCDFEVLQVELRSGRATGVIGRDPSTRATVRIEADTVVLTAGTVETTRLAAQALTEAGALARPRLSGLADHIVQGFVARLPGSADALAALGFEPGSYYVPSDERTRSYLRLDLHPMRAGEMLADIRTTGEQLPSQDSFVECVPTGGYPWTTRIRTALCAEDHRLLDAQRGQLQHCWDTLTGVLGLPGSRLDFEDFGRQHRNNTFVLPQHIRVLPPGQPVTWLSLLGTEDHEGGTLPIGRILTTRQEFAGIPGLFALGPATFPRLGAANPGLTVLALARRLAAVLSE